MIIAHMMRYKHENVDNLRKKNEQKQAEIDEGFLLLDTGSCKALPLMRCLDNSGHPISGHPELPVEKVSID